MAAKNPWIAVAGMAGFSAVALGALGAHAVMHSSEGMKDTWKTGSLYHLIHSCALGIAATQFHGRKRGVVCSLFASGILLFSGACYLIVYMDQKKPYNMLAPVGGCLLLGGWGAFGMME